MTVAVWILSSFLVVCVTMIALGLAIRPYVAELRDERDQWKARALEAEGRVGRDDPYEGFRLVDPKDHSDIFTKGLEL